MYRLISVSNLRSLQLRLPGVQVRSSLKVIMDSKQEDIQQPIGKQPDPKEARQFTTATNVEGSQIFNYICFMCSYWLLMSERNIDHVEPVVEIEKKPTFLESVLSTVTPSSSETKPAGTQPRFDFEPLVLYDYQSIFVAP